MKVEKNCNPPVDQLTDVSKEPTSESPGLKPPLPTTSAPDPEMSTP